MWILYNCLLCLPHWYLARMSSRTVYLSKWNPETLLVLKQHGILDLWGIAEHQQLPVYIEHDGAGLKTNQCKSLITGTNCVALWAITHPGYKLYGYKKQIIIFDGEGGEGVGWVVCVCLCGGGPHHRQCQQNKLIKLLIFTLSLGLTKSCG